MSLPVIVILIGFAILTLWGALAPRSQWRVLAGWTRHNPYASEPGPVSVGIHRVVAIVATVVLVFSGVSLYNRYVDSLPKPAPPASALEKMWGAPAPLVVNRVIHPVTALPSGLIDQPILRYQAMDGSRRIPAYLFNLQDWAPTTTHSGDGFVGITPSPGLTALDTASIVLQVRGDRACLPRSVVAIEGATTIAIAVFYGRPQPKSGAAAGAVADCSPTPDASNAVSLLVPVVLSAQVGKRAVVNLDGSAITATPDLINFSSL